jgi:predicted dehydrogenase
MAEKINIGICGCSSRIKSLLNILPGLGDDLEIHGLYDPDKKRVSEFKEKFNTSAKSYDSYEEMLEDPSIHWVAISTWNSLHAEQTIAAFKAGKDVYCEKPLAINIDDCYAMRDAQIASGKKFMIGFTLRYSPHYRKIKEIIDSGAIGKIISLEFNENLDMNHGGHIMCCWRRQKEFTGAHILEKCCHDIDIVNWLVESRPAKVASFGGLDFFLPENAYHMERLEKNSDGHNAYCSWPTAQGNNPFTSEKNIIDNQVAIIEFKNAVRATFHTNLNAGILERRLYILGTEGTIRADAITGKIELRKIGFNEEIQDLSTGVKGGHAGGDEVLVQHWRDVIFEDKPVFTSLDDGLNSAIASLSIDVAMRTNRIISMEQVFQD